jgi:hypothetical protein
VQLSEWLDCAAEHCVVRRLSLAGEIGTTTVCLSAAKKRERTVTAKNSVIGSSVIDLRLVTLQTSDVLRFSTIYDASA